MKKLIIAILFLGHLSNANEGVQKVPPINRERTPISADKAKMIESEVINTVKLYHMSFQKNSFSLFSETVSIDFVTAMGGTEKAKERFARMSKTPIDNVKTVKVKIYNPGLAYAQVQTDKNELKPWFELWHENSMWRIQKIHIEFEPN
jgi:hypothetical protein